MNSCSDQLGQALRLFNRVRLSAVITSSGDKQGALVWKVTCTAFPDASRKVFHQCSTSDERKNLICPGATAWLRVRILQEPFTHIWRRRISRRIYIFKQTAGPPSAPNPRAIPGGCSSNQRLGAGGGKKKYILLAPSNSLLTCLWQGVRSNSAVSA